MKKRVLITGENSYIGSKFQEYTTKYYDAVDAIDMCTDDWKNFDFSAYDVVIHVAAIVHKQEKSYTQQQYYEVNTKLASDVAKKAKSEGVSQFVFLSTMSVYGVMNGVITKDTLCKPFNDYGKSKLQAEMLLNDMCDDSFVVSILRPPIVYGKGCKGNYNELSAFARKMPFFPNYKSQRSMIYIDNLCEIIKLCIDNKLSGVFCPQDSDYINTSHMVQLIAGANGRKIRLTKFFNPFITLALKMRIRVVQKVFGSLTYEKELCPQYTQVDLETAIRKTEEK